MCGIIGYIGFHANSNTIKGLRMLEYRGYDSFGIAYYDNGYNVFKKKGRISLFDGFNKESNICIGHTRWATHGIPSDINAHPHYSYDKRFLIVHNGIVENYDELKRKYLNNIKNISTTDSEVLINLVAYFNKGNVMKAIIDALKIIKGNYAFIIVDTLTNIIYTAKYKSPLFIGKNDNIMITSDMITLNNFDKCFNQMDKTLCVIDNDVSFYDYNFNKININMIDVCNNTYDSSLKGYNSYMYKEIHEFKEIIIRIKEKYVINKIDYKIYDLLKKDIYLIGSGSSYNAALLAKIFFNKIVNVYRASEFIYDIDKINKNSCFIILSQSGETADILNIIDNLENTILLTNNINSTLALKSKYVIDLLCGPEIAVASTKCYMAEALIINILSNKCNINDLDELISHIDLIDENKINDYASNLNDRVIYIGSGIDYYLALEASLKLKEITYINCYAYPSGELKHGPLAIVDDKTDVILIKSFSNNSKLNLKEAIIRGANGIVIGDNEDLDSFNIKLSFILIIMIIDLISYYKALSLGLDIDKPRNLAKAVTVL